MPQRSSLRESTGCTGGIAASPQNKTELMNFLYAVPVRRAPPAVGAKFNRQLQTTQN